MPQYDFSTLNDKDLENLSRDLLSKELDVPFQSFKVGKDKGIDLRYSTPILQNDIVVQVKHYYKSGCSVLKSKLKKDELPKVIKLNPRQYIIVTSVSLSPTDKESIMDIMSPYILSTGDIYGADDINRLLVAHPEVEKAYFKLWFSNTEIINKILTNGIQGRSSFHESKIRKNIELYVFTKSYKEALKILDEEKVLLITGTPGIGKTSLANMIIYNLLAKEVKLVYIEDSIKDAEDVFDSNPESKQLFYFDDFLGSNYLDIISSKNADKAIVNFVERIRMSRNKYLILTTRSTILNQARTASEQINRANFHSSKYELEISDYSKHDKALILYNHLYFNNIGRGYIDKILVDRNYLKIIKHENYNPRIIEYFTKISNIEKITPEQYMQHIFSTLDNPCEIWDWAVNIQLNDNERCLLYTLLSLDKRVVYKKHLEYAFNAKIDCEVANYGLRKDFNAFNTAFKNLLDGYITNIVYSSSVSGVDFINPSLKDYLISYFNINQTEKWRLIESFVYVDQFVNLFKPAFLAENHIVINQEEIQKFLSSAETQVTKSMSYTNSVDLSLELICFYYSYVKDHHFLNYIDEYIVAEFEKIYWPMADSSYQPDDLLNLLTNISDRSKSYHWIKENWADMANFLFQVSDYEEQISCVMDLFKRFEVDYYTFRVDDDAWCKLVEETLSRVVDHIIDEEIEQDKCDIRTEEDYYDLQDRINQRQYDLTNLISPQYYYSSFSLAQFLDMNKIICENRQADYEAESYLEEWEYEDRNDRHNEDYIIEALFSYYE